MGVRLRRGLTAFDAALVAEGSFGIASLLRLVGLLLGFGFNLVEVIFEFFGGLFVFIAQTKFKLSLLGAQDDRLAFHPPDHVEGRARGAAQGHLEQVLLDAGFDRLAQLALDLKVAVRRAEPTDALVGLAMVVIADPELDAFARRFEALELRADQKILPERGPEALDLAEGHRVLRARFEMGNALLFHLRFKARCPAPGGILWPAIGEHLLGRLILGGGDAKGLEHRLRARAAKEIGADDETRVVIEEGDQIGIAAT